MIDMRTEWPEVPTFDELSEFIRVAPGVEYCWSLVRNCPKAKREEGWVYTHHIPPMQIAGVDVMLLSRGEPIPGARFECTAPTVFLDPELVTELRAKGLEIKCGDDPPPVAVPEQHNGKKHHNQQQHANR